MADNGTSTAKIKAQEAAEAAPTAPTAPETPEMTAKEAGVKEVGKVEVVAPEASPEVPEATDDATGGQGFAYGVPPEETPEDAKAAEAVRVHDEFLRSQNPDGVVVRAAGTSGEVGGESFGYGGAPKE